MTKKKSKITFKTFSMTFGNQKNADDAVSLLNKGWTFKAIGDLLGCSAAMVSKFYLFKIESGMVFEERNNRYMRKKQDFSLPNGEKVNQGMKYSQYLKIENEKMKELRRIKEKEARDTIAWVRKMRKKQKEEEAKYTFRLK